MSETATDDEYPEGDANSEDASVADLTTVRRVSAPTWSAFQAACRALKQAETAFKAAQIAYAEAVKKLSEEAVK